MRANTGPKTIGGLKPLPQWHSPSAGPACNHARWLWSWSLSGFSAFRSIESSSDSFDIVYLLNFELFLVHHLSFILWSWENKLESSVVSFIVLLILTIYG